MSDTIQIHDTTVPLLEPVEKIILDRLVELGKVKIISRGKGDAKE